jgi:hypothetical protein
MGVRYCSQEYCTTNHLAITLRKAYINTGTAHTLIFDYSLYLRHCILGVTMDPLSLLGFVARTTSLFFRARQNYGRYLAFFERQDPKYVENLREYGTLLTWTLYFVFPNALSVMDRVERYVLRENDPRKVTAFLESYTSSFNMVGVAVSTVNELKQLMSLTSFRELSLHRSPYRPCLYKESKIHTGLLKLFLLLVSWLAVCPSIIPVLSAQLSRGCTARKISRISSVNPRRQQR